MWSVSRNTRRSGKSPSFTTCAAYGSSFSSFSSASLIRSKVSSSAGIDLNRLKHFKHDRLSLVASHRESITSRVDRLFATHTTWRRGHGTSGAGCWAWQRVGAFQSLSRSWPDGVSRVACSWECQRRVSASVNSGRLRCLLASSSRNSTASASERRSRNISAAAAASRAARPLLSRSGFSRAAAMPLRTRRRQRSTTVAATAARGGFRAGMDSANAALRRRPSRE